MRDEGRIHWQVADQLTDGQGDNVDDKQPVDGKSDKKVTTATVHQGVTDRDEQRRSDGPTDSNQVDVSLLQPSLCVR